MLIDIKHSKQPSLKHPLTKYNYNQKLKIQSNHNPSKNIMDSMKSMVKQKYGRKYLRVSQHNKGKNKNTETSATSKNSKMQECGRRTFYNTPKKQREKQFVKKRHLKRNTWNNSPIQIRKQQIQGNQFSKQSISKRHTTINQLSINVRTHYKTNEELDMSTRNTFNEASRQWNISKLKKISFIKLQKISATIQKPSLVDLIKKFKFQNIKKDKDNQQKQFNDYNSKSDFNRFFLENQNSSEQIESPFSNENKLMKKVKGKKVLNFMKESFQKDNNLKNQHKVHLSPWVTTNDFFLNHDCIQL